MTKKTTTYPTLTRAQVAECELAQVHTSNEPRLVAILSEVPGYVEARSALLELSARKPTSRPAVQAVEVVHDAIVDALMDGDPIPDDLLATVPGLAAIPVYEGRHNQLGIAVVANGAQVLLAQVEADALRRATTTIRGRLDHLLSSNSDRILRAISDQLEDLVDSARKVLTGRGRIADADDAIAQARVEEYRLSASLEAEYVELRRLQLYWSDRSNMRVKLRGVNDEYAAFVRDPHLVATDLSRVVTNRAYREDADERAYQKSASRGRPFWPSSWIDADALWWFAANPSARPWAPTGMEWDKAQEQLAGAHAEHRRGARRGNAVDLAPTSDTSLVGRLDTIGA